MTQKALLTVGIALAVAGCGTADCMRQSTLYLGSPDGRAEAAAFHGGCGERAGWPRVSVKFRSGPQAETVLTAERQLVLRMQWTSAARLEIDYRSDHPGVIRERLLRVGPDSVRVILRGVAPRRPFRRS